MKPKIVKKKDLINLIKDNLIYTRLVYGLELLGLNMDNYSLTLNETIFKLMGVKEDNESFFEKHIENCKAIHTIDIFKRPDLLNKMAVRLYNEIKQEYNNQKREKSLN